MGETRLYKSKPKLLGQIAAAALLAVLCPLLTAHAGERPVTQYLAGWGGAVLFGAGTVLLVREYLANRPMLVLDDRGLSGPGLETLSFVPWPAVDSVAIADRRRRSVVIAIDEDRLNEADRQRMNLRKPVRDRRGYLLAQVKVGELTVGAAQLAGMLAEHVERSDRRA